MRDRVIKREEGLHVLLTGGWLTEVSTEFRNSLLAEARWRHFERGEQISLAGDEKGDLIGVADGFVAFHTSFGQPGSPILHVTPPVFWFGYRSIVADDPRVATGTAMSRVACAMISYKHARALLDARPESWQHKTVLAMECGDTAATVASDLTIRDSETRLTAVLLCFAGLRRPAPGAPSRHAGISIRNPHALLARLCWVSATDDRLQAGRHEEPASVRISGTRQRPAIA